jgi:p-hydroxybenzoate 3-monooxygenase
MNLAVSDVLMLADGLTGHYRGSGDGLEAYSRRALSRVWKAERFSWWLTGITHRFPDASPFSQKMQLAELDYLRESEAAQRSFAENYVGLPMARTGR